MDGRNGGSVLCVSSDHKVRPGVDLSVQPGRIAIPHTLNVQLQQRFKPSKSKEQ